MNAQLLALRKRVVEQAVINPDLLGDELTFTSNAAEPIDFNGVLITKDGKQITSDEGRTLQVDATLLLLLTDYQAIKAAVADLRDDGWVEHNGTKFYFSGTTDNNGVTIVALMTTTTTTALGRAYPRTAGRASHK